MISPLPTESLVHLKNQEELRAGIRNLLGFTTLEELTEELSQVADVILTAALEEECKTHRVKKVPLAVFALGKYGTREITFDADLDIIFVARDFSRPTSDRLERIAEGVMQRLTSVSAEGKLYDVDARLRPEGKNAPLVVDRAAYETYLLTRASLWERQSLTRLRFICGDAALGKDVATMVGAWVYDLPLPASWVDTIVGMRRKTETRSRTQAAEFFDLKLGPGGMVDIEFLAQMIQLKWGGAHAEVRHKGTRGVLHAARSLALSVHADEETLLSESYRVYREIEKLMRITLEERGSILPEGQRLELLGRCFQATTDRGPAVSSGDTAPPPDRNKDLRESVASRMKLVRSIFLAKSQSFSSREGRS
jgi:glutamate-ammonia-ligase adenylyltransferase